MTSSLGIVALSAGFCVLAGIAAAACAAEPAAPAPKKVAILIFEGVEVIDYSGPLEVFADAGFDVFTVAATKHPVRTHAGDAVTLTPRYSFDDAPQADLIVIPGGNFEAPRDSATTKWIKRESAGTQHIMSVCNGAFTLANTGLLDGLSATTTAGNIARFMRSYPAIKVLHDRRVVDNGKILATAGLSAGIDGALHMVDVMKGEGAGQSVALGIEYDWRPHGDFVRGAMADRLLARVNYPALGEIKDSRRKGDRDYWEGAIWIATKQSATELFGALKTAYEKGYADDGPWAAGSFQAAQIGSDTADFRLDDRDGQHWQGTLAVEPTTNDPHQFVMRVTIKRVG